MTYQPKHPVCIHCAAAIEAGLDDSARSAHHRPGLANCAWHPSHRELAEAINVESCRRLVAEVLRSGVSEARGEGWDTSAQTIGAARVWIEDGEVGPLTFNFCCSVLDYDANDVRDRERRAWGRAA